VISELRMMGLIAFGVARSLASEGDTLLEIQNRVVSEIPLANQLKTPVQTASQNNDEKDADYKVDFEGEKSLRVNTGSSGGTGIEQSLRLKISGQLSHDLWVEGLLSDQNLPASAEGASSTLRDVDQIWIRFYSAKSYLNLGDALLNYEGFKLINYSEKITGVDAQTRQDKFALHTSLGQTRGERFSIRFAGKEGVVGDYPISQSESIYGNIIPGTEKVWKNGVLLNPQKDYSIDYNLGILRFTQGNFIKSTDEFTVEFQKFDLLNNKSVSAIQGDWIHKNSVMRYRWIQRKDDLNSGYFGTLNSKDINQIKNSSANTVYSQNDIVTVEDQAPVRYRLQDGVWVYIPHNEVVNGETVFLPVFSAVLPGMGDYQKRTELTNAGDLIYYEYIGSGLGEYVVGQQLRTPIGQQWMGVQSDFKFRTSVLSTEFVTSVKDSNTLNSIKSPYAGRAIDVNFNSDSGFARPLWIGYQGRYQDSLFSPFESFQEWGSYRELWDLDSAKNSGRQSENQVDLKFRLNPRWVLGGLWGYKEGQNSETWFSEKKQLRLNHRGLKSNSELKSEFVQTESSIKSSRLRSEIGSESKLGWLRPYGKGLYEYRITTKPEDSLEWGGRKIFLTSGAETEVSQSGLSSDTRLIAEKSDSKKGGGAPWQDSTQAVETIQKLIWQPNYDFRDELYLQYRIQEDKPLELNPGSNREYWTLRNDMAGGGYNKGYEFTSGYKLESTQEQPLVRLYELVPDGTGDVRYDSINNQYLENVDDGNLRFIGLGLDSSLSPAPARDLEVRLNLNLFPGTLAGIDKGFVRDIRLNLNLELSHRDTTEKLSLGGWVPSYRPAHLNQKASGYVRTEAGMYWKLPDGKVWSDLRGGQVSEKSTGQLAAVDIRDFWFSESGYRIIKPLDLVWIFEQETRQRKASALNNFPEIEYESFVQENQLRYRFLKFYGLQPALRRKNVQGVYNNGKIQSQIVQYRLQLSREFYQVGSLNVEYSLNQVTTPALSLLFWDITEGYEIGNTHRLEVNSDINASDNFILTGRYIYRNSEVSGDFHRLSLEVRAVF
jgi:hypothetical protein